MHGHAVPCLAEVSQPVPIQFDIGVVRHGLYSHRGYHVEIMCTNTTVLLSRSLSLGPGTPVGHTDEQTPDTHRSGR